MRGEHRIRQRVGIVLAEVMIAVVVLATFVALAAGPLRASRERQLETLDRLDSLAAMRQCTSRMLAEGLGRQSVADGGDNVAVTATKYDYPGAGGLLIVRCSVTGHKAQEDCYEVILHEPDATRP